MSGVAMELDFFEMGKQTSAATTKSSSKSSFKKFLDRSRSFRDVQGGISRIDPEIIKSVIASGNQFHSRSRSISVPSSPTESRPQISVQPVHLPKASSGAEKVANSAPLTIFYNGTVSVFDLSPEKAERIMKFASEGYLNRDGEEQKPSVNVDGDLPIARRKSLKRFLEKRKERLSSVSPYSLSDLNWFERAS